MGILEIVVPKIPSAGPQSIPITVVTSIATSSLKNEKDNNETEDNTQAAAALVDRLRTNNDEMAKISHRAFDLLNSQPTFAEQMLNGPEGEMARRRSQSTFRSTLTSIMSMKSDDLEAMKEQNRPSEGFFAEQMLAGPKGKNARKHYRLSSDEKDNKAAQMMDELRTSNGGTIHTLFEKDCEDSHCEESTDESTAATPISRKQPGMKQTIGRHLSQIQRRQFGIEHDDAEDDTENMFVKTMGMEENDSMPSLMQTTGMDMYNTPFDSVFKPNDMRCLALVAHNHMKPAMLDFVKSHKEILKKFRLTGTNTTMTMLKEVFGDDPNVQYGPSFSSGPLGGDAELSALMSLQDLGGMVFFQDPLSAHPHQADIDSLNRLANVHNILTANNPSTAHALCFVLKCALEAGRLDKIPSFFCTLKSPGVKVYQERQKMALEAAKSGKTIAEY